MKLRISKIDQSGQAHLPLCAKGGQALIEFAFCVFFLILLILGFVELGSAFWTAQAVANASREGARTAAICEELIENDPRVGQTVHNYLERASLPAEGTEITNDAASDSGDKVKVRVTFPYKWISPFPGFIGSEKLNICRATTIRYDPYRYSNGNPIPRNGTRLPSPAQPEPGPLPNAPSPVRVPVLPFPWQPPASGGSPVRIPE